MSHKQDAHAHAAQRMTEQEHLSAQPSLPISDKDVSQARFPGETPLTGEDRLLDEAGSKQEGYSATGAADRAAAGHPEMRGGT